MSSEDQKAIIEERVFREFLKKASLTIDPTTIEKRHPPEPDIFCRRFSGEPLAFELVEICDSNLAKAISTADSGYIRTSDPSWNVLKNKLSKSYETPYDIELLCYVGGRVITPDDVLIPTVTPLIEYENHVFKRVWLLGSGASYLLWEQSCDGY